MSFFLISTLILNSVIGFLLYIILYKKRKVLTDRYGMIMAMCSSGVLSLNIAMITSFLYTNNLSFIIFFTTAVGGIIGILFGSLVKFQSVLSGFSHGVTGGIMGTMLSAVIQNPSLCSLPVFYLNTIDHSMISFCIFGTFLVFLTFGLLFYSLRV